MLTLQMFRLREVLRCAGGQALAPDRVAKTFGQLTYRRGEGVVVND